MGPLHDLLGVPLGMGLSELPADVRWKATLARARRGEPSGFESLMRQVQRPVYGLCVRLLANEAEASEATQETFLKAFQNLHRYDDARPFDLWVLTIARNLCVDWLRRRGHVLTQDLDQVKETVASPEPSVEAAVIAHQERQSLEAAMATLSPEDREVLALYYVQKRTTREIAEILGVAPGTIMARLFRAREKLRKRMPPEAVT